MFKLVVLYEAFRYYFYLFNVQTVIIMLHFCCLGAGGATCRTEKAASVSCQQGRGDSHPAGLTQQHMVFYIQLYLI